MTIRRPLDGMLVLDLGQIYNGPYCGLMLGFMGARVLKIEPPEGDVVRRRKREVEPWPLVMLNSNKESVVLDLKQARGKQLFLELVAKADVLIENFAVGVMDRLGLGWDTLSKLNPRLVYGGSSGFGLYGPYRDLAAMDVTIQAMSGITNATGQLNITKGKVNGPVSVTARTGGVRIDTVTVNGAITVNKNAGSQPVVVAANTISGPLACSGNTPAPANESRPNTVKGPA